LCSFEQPRFAKSHILGTPSSFERRDTFHGGRSRRSKWGANMATNVNRVSELAPEVRPSLAEPRPFGASATSAGLPSIQCEILAQLATKATDAKGYAALEVPGHDVGAIDDAIEALHQAGLLNAFFVNQAARPRYHPSSLTREGRRFYDQYQQR
jgi:hypothetical protein